MRRIILVISIALLAGCASRPEYFDNHAAVDRNLLCASRPDHPNEPVSKDCQRTSGMRWSNAKNGEPLDLSGGKKKKADD